MEAIIRPLYTRPMVEWVADQLGNADLVERYFLGFEGAFRAVDSVLSQVPLEALA